MNSQKNTGNRLKCLISGVLVSVKFTFGQFMVEITGFRYSSA